MKSQPEIQDSFDPVFDRTSTREELFQVMELLGGSLSNIVASRRAGQRDVVSSQGILEETELWNLWSDEAESNVEVASGTEIEPLADLLRGNRQLPN